MDVSHWEMDIKVRRRRRRKEGGKEEFGPALIMET